MESESEDEGQSGKKDQPDQNKVVVKGGGNGGEAVEEVKG